MPELNCCPSQLIICKVSGSTWRQCFSQRKYLQQAAQPLPPSRKPSLIAGAQLRALLWKMSGTHLWFSTCHSSIKISHLQSWLFRVRDRDIFISVPPALTVPETHEVPSLCPLLLSLCCVLHAHFHPYTNSFHSEAKTGPLTRFASCPSFRVLSFVILIIFLNRKSGLHPGLVFLPPAHIQLLIHALLIFPLEISLPVLLLSWPRGHCLSFLK